MKRDTTVWVKNNGGEAFCDRFDGEDFEIPPGGAVEMLPEAAKLCFGFGEEDKSRCIRRLGWAVDQNKLPLALARLNKFSFHSKDPTDLESAPQVDREAAPGPGRLGAASHLDAGAYSEFEAKPADPPAAEKPAGRRTMAAEPGAGASSNLLGKLAGAQAPA